MPVKTTNSKEEPPISNAKLTQRLNLSDNAIMTLGPGSKGISLPVPVFHSRELMLLCLACTVFNWIEKWRRISTDKFPFSNEINSWIFTQYKQRLLTKCVEGLWYKSQKQHLNWFSLFIWLNIMRWAIELNVIKCQGHLMLLLHFSFTGYPHPVPTGWWGCTPIQFQLDADGK